MNDAKRELELSVLEWVVSRLLSAYSELAAVLAVLSDMGDVFVGDMYMQAVAQSWAIRVKSLASEVAALLQDVVHYEVIPRRREQKNQ